MLSRYPQSLSDICQEPLLSYKVENPGSHLEHRSSTYREARQSNHCRPHFLANPIPIGVHCGSYPLIWWQAGEGRETTMDPELRAALTAIENRLSRIEAKVDAIPVLLSNMRDCLAVLDEQVRGQGAILTRLEESISMDPSAQA
jgi:hypothetical protein